MVYCLYTIMDVILYDYCFYIYGYYFVWVCVIVLGCVLCLLLLLLYDLRVLVLVRSTLCSLCLGCRFRVCLLALKLCWLF